MKCGKTVFVFLVDCRALFEKTLQRRRSPRDPPAYRNTPSHGLHLPTLLPHGAASLHGLWTPCSDHYARAATTFSSSVGDPNLGLRDFTFSFSPFVLKAETLKGLSPRPASAADWAPLRNNKARSRSRTVEPASPRLPDVARGRRRKQSHVHRTARFMFSQALTPERHRCEESPVARGNARLNQKAKTQLRN